MVTRYPHTAVIRWKSQPTKNGDGTFTEGADFSLSLKGRLEVGSSSSYVGENGREIKRSDKFTCELIIGSIPTTATIEVLGQTRKVVNYMNYSTHSVIWL